MASDYRSVINSLKQSPLKQNGSKKVEAQKAGRHKYDYSFSAQPSQEAVHPRDNTSEKEPDQPGVLP